MPKGAIKDVQQSKIPDARDRKRDSLMADQPYVAYGLDNGSRGERLPAGIQADENTSGLAYRPRAGAAALPLRA